MQILLPMAGTSSFFPESEFFFPKPLVEVVGRPMIQVAIEALKRDFPDAEFIFVINQEDAARFSLDATLSLLTTGQSKIVRLASPTKGALCTALMAADKFKPDEPLLIANYDQIIEDNLADAVSAFQRENAKAGVVTFDSIHPRWSYVRTNEQGAVIEAAEKRVISRRAIAGVYYFSQASDFMKAAEETILNGDDYDGRYYIAPCLNRFVVAGERVVAHNIEPDCYHTFFTPNSIDAYSDRMMRRSLRSESEPEAGCLSVIIPAAGQGSRFQKAGWKKPKPFIDVGGQPMIRRVIDNVSPAGSKPTILLRSESIDSYPEIVSDLRAAGSDILEVDALTEGTACTVLLARQAFENKPLLVANSDQLVDFDCTAFVQDCIDRGLDGSILCFEDKEKNPKWSFARVDGDGIVQEVAEKKPISELATVGIYLFMNGQDFVNAAVDMIARNDRVNNEFYTCPVYNYLIRMGKKIGVYTVDASAMHGLGIPEDLETYLGEQSLAPSADRPD